MSKQSNHKGTEMDISKIEQAVAHFQNNSDLKFDRIDSEEFRCYVFPAGAKTLEVRIDNPLYLAVSASGGHRLFDADGKSHYIPAGWMHLYWKAREGQPHFVK
jgi:hypothetical protein